METATKAGNFDRARAIKSRIDAFEAGVGNPRPKDVVNHAGHEYAVNPVAVTWHTAKRNCEVMGGHLACAETPQENAFLLALCAKVNVDV